MKTLPYHILRILPSIIGCRVQLSPFGLVADLAYVPHSAILFMCT